jgi:hypothetical protein
MYDKIDKILAPEALAKLQAEFPDCEIYLTGSASQPGKTDLAGVKDIDVVLVLPEGKSAQDRAAYEQRAKKMTLPTTKPFADLTLRDTLPVDATARTRENFFGVVTADAGVKPNGKPRTPLEYARVGEPAKHGDGGLVGPDAKASFEGARPSADQGGNLPASTLDYLMRDMPELKLDPKDPGKAIGDFIARELGVDPKDIEATPLGGGKSGAEVFAVKYKGVETGVFKIFRSRSEMLREVAALKKVQEAGLKLMKPVDPLMNARVDGAKGGKESGGLLMEKAEGDFVASTMKTTGQTTQPAERQALIDKLKQDVTSVGRAMAEMHDNMASGADVAPEYKKSEIGWLAKRWEGIAKSGRVDAVEIDAMTAQLKDISKQFEGAKLKATVAHGDAHVGNFAARKDGSVSMIDSETLYRSVGDQGQGIATGASDVGRYIESIETQGRALGMSPTEIMKVQRAFEEAYKGASKNFNPDFQIAEKFYQINLDTIVLDAAIKGGKPLEIARAKRMLRSRLNDLGMLDLDLAKNIDAADGGHSMDRHGADIADDKLKERVTKGLAPNSTVDKPIVAATAASTQFDSDFDWVDTRDTAIAAIQQIKGIDVTKPPPEGAPTSADIVVDHGRMIDKGFRGVEASKKKIQRPGQPDPTKKIKVYDQVEEIGGLTRTYTKIEWNKQKQRWVVVQHFPTADGWDQATGAYSGRADYTVPAADQPF